MTKNSSAWSEIDEVVGDVGLERCPYCGWVRLHATRCPNSKCPTHIQEEKWVNFRLVGVVLVALLVVVTMVVGFKALVSWSARQQEVQLRMEDNPSIAFCDDQHPGAVEKQRQIEECPRYQGYRDVYDRVNEARAQHELPAVPYGGTIPADETTTTTSTTTTTLLDPTPFGG